MTQCVDRDDLPPSLEPIPEFTTLEPVAVKGRRLRRKPNKDNTLRETQGGKKWRRRELNSPSETRGKPDFLTRAAQNAAHSVQIQVMLREI